MGRRKTSDKKTLRLCSAVVLAVLITVAFPDAWKISKSHKIL
jgi:hypothetical protein